MGRTIPCFQDPPAGRSAQGGEIKETKNKILQQQQRDPKTRAGPRAPMAGRDPRIAAYPAAVTWLRPPALLQ